MYKFVLAAVLSLILPSIPAHCQVNDPTPTPSPFPSVRFDVDGDGVTDAAKFTILTDDGSANNVLFDGVNSANQSSFNREFGKNNVAAGEYTGDGIWDLASVEERELDGGAAALIWRIRDTASGDRFEIEFGLPDDTALSGCDFDADGISDLAVVRANSLHVRFSSTEEEASAALPLPESASLKQLECADYNGDGHPELVALVSVKDVSEERRVRRRASGCKRPKSRRCKKRRKSKPNPGARSHSLHIATVPTVDSDESFESEALLNAEVSEPQGVFCLDTNGDETEECVTFRKLRRGITRMNIYALGANAVEQRDVALFTEAAAGKFQDDQEQSVARVLLLSKQGQVRLYDFTAQTDTDLGLALEGDSLAKGVNTHFTGGVSPADPDGYCSEVFPAEDGSLGFLIKNSDHHAGMVVLVNGEFQKAFERAFIMKDGRELLQLAFTGWGNPDYIESSASGVQAQAGRWINRQHWRYYGTYAQNLPAPYFFVGVLKGKAYCWYAPQSKARVD